MDDNTEGRRLTVVRECSKVTGRTCNCPPTRECGPDAEADGYMWPAPNLGSVSSLPVVGSDESSVAVEAQSLVYGDRQGQYGHPRDNFTVTAQLWTVVLQHKLEDGAFVTPEDVARCMRMVKEARQLHAPKRDNLVDIIGYAIAEDRLETGR